MKEKTISTTSRMTSTTRLPDAVITIPGTFKGLNDYTRKNRSNAYSGNNMKKRDQSIICLYLPKRKFNYINVSFNYFEPNAKRDKDNISSYFRKIFFDAMVQAGCIPNDNWRYVGDMEDHFSVDRKNPRIEVEIYEETNTKR